jgi:hypothetical protein
MPSAAAVCTASPSEKCFFDDLCLSGSSGSSDPYNGLGCSAGGYAGCRFCGFGLYYPLACPYVPGADGSIPDGLFDGVATLVNTGPFSPVNDAFLGEVRYEFQIRIAIVLAASVGDFGGGSGTLATVEATMLPRLSFLLRVPSASIALSVTAASLSLEATVTSQSPTEVQSVLATYSTMSLANASAVLGAPVLSREPAKVSRLTRPTNLPTLVLEGASSGASGSTVIVVVVIGLVAAALVALVCYCRRRRRSNLERGRGWISSKEIGGDLDLVSLQIRHVGEPVSGTIRTSSGTSSGTCAESGPPRRNDVSNDVSNDVFISFRFDESHAEAKALKTALEAQQLRVYLAGELPGELLDEVIFEALDSSRLAVLLASETYVLPLIAC